MPCLTNPAWQVAAGFLAIASLCSHAQVAKGQLPALELADLLCTTESITEIQHDNSDLPSLKNSVAKGYYFATPESAENFLSETEKKGWDLYVSNYFHMITGKPEHWQYRAVMRRNLDVDGSEAIHWMVCELSTIPKEIECGGDSTFNFYFQTGRFLEISVGTSITNYRTDLHNKNSIVRVGSCIHAAP